MSKGLIKILCLFCILYFGTSMSQKELGPIPESHVAVHKLLDQAANFLSIKYSMQTIGTNIAMPRSVIKTLGLHFQIKGPLSREELRKILIFSSRDFLSIINSEHNVRKYLEKYPFALEDIDITLFIDDKNGKDLIFPDIGIAKIKYGKIEYDCLTETYNDDLKIAIPRYSDIYKESYEEALKLLQTAEEHGNKEERL